MFYPSIVFNEPCSYDLLLRTPHAFLANPVHRVYYVLHHQSFLSKSAHLIYYVSPLNHFSELGSSDLLCFTPQSVWWVKLGGDLGDVGMGVVQNGDRF